MIALLGYETGWKAGADAPTKAAACYKASQPIDYSADIPVEDYRKLRALYIDNPSPAFYWAGYAEGINDYCRRNQAEGE